MSCSIGLFLCISIAHHRERPTTMQGTKKSEQAESNSVPWSLCTPCRKHLIGNVPRHAWMNGSILEAEKSSCAYCSLNIISLYVFVIKWWWTVYYTVLLYERYFILLSSSFFLFLYDDVVDVIIIWAINKYTIFWTRLKNSLKSSLPRCPPTASRDASRHMFLLW